MASYYDRLVTKYPNDSAKACGWVSESTQQLRCEILSLVGDMRGASVLDVGCGLGGFWHYLQTSGISCDYIGVDLSSAMVKAAREHHPGVTFLNSDWRKYFASEPVDFLVASGALSFRDGPVDNLQDVRDFLTHFFPQITSGMAFNLLSSHTPKSMRGSGSRFVYYDPEKVLALCLEFTPYVALRQDYLPNDFTVTLYK